MGKKLHNHKHGQTIGREKIMYLRIVLFAYNDTLVSQIALILKLYYQRQVRR
jgi:hypothetical protein